MVLLVPPRQDLLNVTYLQSIRSRIIGSLRHWTTMLQWIPSLQIITQYLSYGTTLDGGPYAGDVYYGSRSELWYKDA